MALRVTPLLFSLVLLGLKEGEEGLLKEELLGDASQDEGRGGDGGHSGSTSSGEDEAPGGGEGGGGPGVEEERLGLGHGDQADGESGGEEALAGETVGSSPFRESCYLP